MKKLLLASLSAIGLFSANPAIANSTIIPINKLECTKESYYYQVEDINYTPAELKLQDVDFQLFNAGWRDSDIYIQQSGAVISVTHYEKDETLRGELTAIQYLGNIYTAEACSSTELEYPSAKGHPKFVTGVIPGTNCHYIGIIKKGDNKFRINMVQHAPECRLFKYAGNYTGIQRMWLKYNNKGFSHLTLNNQ